MTTRTLSLFAAAALSAVSLLVSAGCSETVRTGRSPAYLIIEQIRSNPGGRDDLNDSHVMTSDVRTQGFVFEDHAVADFRLALKDIGQSGSSTSPTVNNAITINRYRVSYRRTDGRNTPGVDVPHPFEGAGTVTVFDRASLEFQIVRLQAKLEAPLSSLVGNNGSRILSTIADVTFYGRDQVGNDVTVTGSIVVNFSDWADPDDVK